ncbi:2-polyprenyl-6-methoxyphenol hydroxylase [Mucilaginibacter pedocola]|uniref:Flavin-dependent monooxygenase n=2 Tax=Mucilaginibacter pedocola TaxID=1792845 RepID=A0A1S9P6U5_9SPHI|nr:2-polyprenyl-6-methoxyphenol hydroxylase [Mucilaginibacter pedocola]
MLIHNKQIAIVGGGPGGLTLARLLQLKGANVKVYERDTDRFARVAGSPLDMHPDSGMAAIKKAGLVEELKQNYRAGADRKVIVDEHARVFFSDHDEQATEGSFNPEIGRMELRNLLLNSLQHETVIWDSHFISMEPQGEGWLLHFKNGVSAYADIVVASDGANSKIRPYITDIKAFYSGITMVEVNVPDAATAAPHIFNLLNGGKVMAFGNGKCILGGQKGEGSLGFYTSLKIAEDWAKTSGLNYNHPQQLLQWFKTEYAGWDEVWGEIFAHAAAPIIPRPIYCMPLDQTWQALPNATMIGDAAHVMPPFAGEGANTAMYDALQLSENLISADYSTLRDAIAAFEADMRMRASASAKRSLENGERMHSEGALQKMLAIFGGNH